MGLDLGEMEVEDFMRVVRKRRTVINFTIAAYVFVFICAFTVIVVAWNTRNLRPSDARKFQKAKNKVLFAAIFAIMATVVVLAAVVARLVARADAFTLPITALLFIFMLCTAMMSVSMFFVYFGNGSYGRGKENKFLKMGVGLGVITLAATLFTLLFSVGLTREVQNILAE